MAIIGGWKTIMECSKGQLVDRLKSWPGRRCFLRALIGNTEVKLWMRYKSASTDSFTFTAGLDGEVSVDLADATACSYGDVKHLPPDLLRGVKVADAVRVKNGELDVTVVLSA